MCVYTIQYPSKTLLFVTILIIHLLLCIYCRFIPSLWITEPISVPLPPTYTSVLISHLQMRNICTFKRASYHIMALKLRGNCPPACVYAHIQCGALYPIPFQVLTWHASFRHYKRLSCCPGLSVTDCVSLHKGLCVK